MGNSPRRSPSVVMRFGLFLLVLIVAVHECIAGSRQFIMAELKQSPLGIGARSALRDHRLSSSWNQRREQSGETPAISCSTNQDRDSRFASVAGNEAEALGIVMAPKLNVKQRKIHHSTSQDEYEALHSDQLVCASRRVDSDSDSSNSVLPTSDTRGGNTLAAATRPLLLWENMVSGAISRSIAQTVMHPANTMKTIAQSSRGPDRMTFGQLFRPSMFKTLSRGAGANFVLSVPHGAVNFAVLELVRNRLNNFVESVPSLDQRKDSFGPGLDFLSSAISTICCSVISTPQMMITDNIMAGNYPSLPAACRGLYEQKGVMGFYSGWWPGLVGKIPSYALTWTFFQKLKRVRDYISDRPAKNYENTMMGCIASGTTVCIMIPLDTIKTRLVTQSSAAVSAGIPYKGIIDCAVRITQEEGIKTFYRGLAPRLISVVPMIGIQFGVYEAMKKVMLKRDIDGQQRKQKPVNVKIYGSVEALEEAAMEISASQDQPYPAPQFLRKLVEKKKAYGRRRT